MQRNVITREQKSLVIEWIAEGYRNFEIKKMADSNGFTVYDTDINYLKRSCKDIIEDVAKEDWRLLPITTGLGRRAKRIEFREILIRRIMDELVPQDKENTVGFDVARMGLLKDFENLMRGIQSEIRDMEPEKIQTIELVNKTGDFDPSSLTDEDLESMLHSIQKRKEAISNPEIDEVKLLDFNEQEESND